jgi:hypothetical protein
VIKRGCDKFVDLHGLSYQEVAERIKRDNVNVLIDLTGYTMSMQTEVMAIGPAPVQVSPRSCNCGTWMHTYSNIVACDRGIYTNMWVMLVHACMPTYIYTYIRTIATRGQTNEHASKQQY